MDVVALIGSLIACVVMAGVAALTGWRLDAVSQRGGGSDDYFWVGFGGVVVITGVGVAGGSAGGPGAEQGVREGRAHGRVGGAACASR